MLETQRQTNPMFESYVEVSDMDNVETAIVSALPGKTRCNFEISQQYHSMW